jgi:ABC-type uncharacterized transport system substrate-binding protein
MTTLALIMTLTLALLVAPRATAQHATKVFRIGMLSVGSPSPEPHPNIEAFRQGLRDLGYMEGQHLVLEYRWAEGQVERLADLAAELVRLPADVIVASGTQASQAAQHATQTIPIVMTSSSDPVGTGLVASLARPGGNVTGLSLLSPALSEKRLALLKDALPGLSRVAIFWHGGHHAASLALHEMADTSRVLGVQLLSLEVQGAHDFERAFPAATQEGAEALIVLSSALFGAERKRLVELAIQHRLPTMFPYRPDAEAGGLMSYGPSLRALYRRAAVYVDKILKGVKPADLPVEQPMGFELVLNLKTAQTLGLTIPPTLLFQADDVIR